jgi:CubicO group peptidase (beta-lactamase class C family)
VNEAALRTALAEVERWSAPTAAAALVDADGVRATHGPLDHGFRLASVTKLVTAYAVLVAVGRGDIDLDEPAGPPGATVRHLLAHASGLGFEGLTPVSRPAATRIYSNGGFDILGDLLADRAGLPVDAVLARDVLGPLGMTTTSLVERPSQGLSGPLGELAIFVRELLRPRLIEPAALVAATTVAFPGLAGILPGVGRFAPLDWGLGFEIRDGKVPHWTGTTNSPRTFGHFGGSGTFLWVDPTAHLALVVLTDRDYGPWALEAWPAFSDAILAAAAGIETDVHAGG